MKPEERAGYVAMGRRDFHRHRQCPLLQGHAKAEDIPGHHGIRYCFGPEDQGETRMQISRPHDAWRAAWMEGWDAERADFIAGKIPEYEEP